MLTNKEIVIFCLKHTAERLIADCEHSGAVPLPQRIGELVSGIGRLLGEMDRPRSKPSEDERDYGAEIERVVTRLRGLREAPGTSPERA